MKRSLVTMCSVALFVALAGGEVFGRGTGGYHGAGMAVPGAEFPVAGFGGGPALNWITIPSPPPPPRPAMPLPSGPGAFGPGPTIHTRPNPSTLPPMLPPIGGMPGDQGLYNFSNPGLPPDAAFRGQFGSPGPAPPPHDGPR